MYKAADILKPQVRRLTALDHRSANILADCYKDDPLIAWMMPHASRRQRINLYREMIRAAIRMNVYIETTGWAVATSEAPWHRLRRMGRGAVPNEVRELHNQLLDALPEQPFWHFTGLASMKKGHATLLTTHREERADREGMVCMGYAANPRSLRYYLDNHHYTAVGEVKTRTSPTVTIIRREPQPVPGCQCSPRWKVEFPSLHQWWCEKATD